MWLPGRRTDRPIIAGEATAVGTTDPASPPQGTKKKPSARIA